MDQNKKQGGHTHSVMSKKLAEALLESGVQHFAIGGFVGDMMGMNSERVGTPSYTDQPFVPVIQQHQRNQWDSRYQQQNLANSMLDQYQGRGGPSIAQSQLNQATGQNVANQAALMAGQRGASANAGLVGRQAAMAGGAAQQQAAGQAATLRAQEQMGLAQMLGQQQQNMAQNALSGESILQGALASRNNAAIQAQLGASQMNMNAAGQNAQQQGNIFGGGMNALGGYMGLGFKGGEVQKMNAGGMAQFPTVGIELPGVTPYQRLKSGGLDSKGAKGNGLETTQGPMMAGGPMDAGGVTDGGSYDWDVLGGGALPMTANDGGFIPGQAEVGGDSIKNDKVPALLSPGEVVLPRSVTQSGGNVEEKAVAFLRSLKSEKRGGYGAVIQARNKGGKVC